jgi:AcrR family transcriptional regulator
MSQGRPGGDLRTRRTRLALRNALLDLIQTKGFDAIVVQDIADRAMINRVTFYKHYRD